MGRELRRSKFSAHESEEVVVEGEREPPKLAGLVGNSVMAVLKVWGDNREERRGDLFPWVVVVMVEYRLCVKEEGCGEVGRFHS